MNTYFFTFAASTTSTPGTQSIVGNPIGIYAPAAFNGKVITVKGEVNGSVVTLFTKVLATGANPFTDAERRSFLSQGIGLDVATSTTGVLTLVTRND
jgi:hypothetical protein